MPLRALVVEDSEDDTLLLAREMRRGGCDLTYERVETAEDMKAALESGAWDVVISDYSMPHFSAPAALRVLNETGLDLPFIIVSGTVGEDVAVEAMKAGAHDYLLKGNLTRLVPAVRREIEQAAHRKASRAAEEQYRLLFEASPQPMWVVDRETLRYLAANDAAVSHYGYSRDEFLSMTIRDIRPAEDVAATVRATERNRPGLQNLGIWRHRKKDGTVIHVDIATHALTFAGRPAWLVLGHDVTDRVRAEEALTKRELYFRSLIENAQDVIAVIDPVGDILFASPAVERILGSPPEQFVGKNAFEFIHPEDAAGAQAALRRAVDDPELPQTLLFRFRHANGSWRTLDGIGKLLAAEGFPRAVVNLRDVTESRALEQQLRQAQKMEAIGRLAGGIAHDFNNILTAILGYGDLASSTLAPDSPLRANLEEIHHAAERAAGLTRQLLIFSRKQVLQPKILDLNAVVEESERLLRRLIGEDVVLVTALTAGVRPVRADPGQIEQVILNLAVNARDAMPRGGRLTIETANVDSDETWAEQHPGTPPGRYVLLAVSDSGTGMDEATKSRIFEPFFTTKEAGKGTGLGLATVYGIVEQAGGLIEVDSEPGRGTKFRIYLPSVEGVPDSAASRSSRRAVRGTETVLVVEDEDQVRRLITKTLRAFGHEVLEAAQPAEALRLCREHPKPIHLLLTDVVMPGMNGPDLAGQCRGLRADVKVIFMSGYTADAMPLQGIEPGLNFLSKPFTPSALARKVREVLDAPEKRPVE
jgi:two-component system cell cycle sensor histidine kinase/response regulator CckA